LCAGAFAEDATALYAQRITCYTEMVSGIRPLDRLERPSCAHKTIIQGLDMAEPVYSLVIPIYNEEESLWELFKRLSALMSRLDGEAEVVLVDDGSRDKSHEIMSEMHERDPRFKIARLSKNFGHQIAITAGMDLASGQAVVIMDADLQDPPEVVLEMAQCWREGYEVVYGVRDERLGETWLKRITATAFYRLLRKFTDLDIPLDVGDFRLVDRKALDAFRAMREHNRYVRGMFSWVGFRQRGVKYVRSERFAGSTKYPMKKMLKLAADGVVSFSVVPLRLALHAGLLIALISFVGGTTALVLKVCGYHSLIPGWASLVAAVSFLGGVQLMLMGVLGEYVGRIYDEVRQRPLYIVRDWSESDQSGSTATRSAAHSPDR
jgi:polyisoprenyl-phosphate glycosyltransferase